jgi:hypothetical protein
VAGNENNTRQLPDHKPGHFYFGRKRTFLKWVDMVEVEACDLTRHVLYKRPHEGGRINHCRENHGTRSRKGSKNQEETSEECETDQSAR